ncbi:armadillo-type protein [Powellomyces hirtus]|nr:armadillo-type protein [Powellomyces hirtus]
MTASSAPHNRPEDIHRIVETVDRYNPQNIPILEAYVEQQLTSADYAATTPSTSSTTATTTSTTYDRDACLAVLKLYQFNPAFSSNKVVCSILQLALGALPDADFGLCLYMLNEDVLKDAGVAALVALHDLLQQARFKAFWAAVEDTPEDVLVNRALFADRIRIYIAGTLAIAYRVISIPTLQSALNLKDAAALDAFLKEHAWTRDPEDKDAVVLPATKENQARPVVVQENIKFEHLTKIIGYGRMAQ